MVYRNPSALYFPYCHRPTVNFFLQVFLRRGLVAFLRGVGIYFFAFLRFLCKRNGILRRFLTWCFVNALRAMAPVGGFIGVVSIVRLLHTAVFKALADILP